MTFSVRLFVSFALMVLVAAPAHAQAGSPVSNSFFHGDIAEAAFFGGGGCTMSDVGITASDGSSYDAATGRQRGPSVRVHVGSFDFCTGQTLHEISADAELAAGQFSVDNGLATAALQASVMAFDQATGQPIALDLRLTWTATSAASMTRLVSMTTMLDGTRELTRADGQLRDAIASGTVSGGGIGFVAGVAAFADLQSVLDGSHVQSSR